MTTNEQTRKAQISYFPLPTVLLHQNTWRSREGNISCSYIATGNSTIIVAIFIRGIIGFQNWTRHYLWCLQYDQQCLVEGEKTEETWSAQEGSSFFRLFTQSETKEKSMLEADKGIGTKSRKKDCKRCNNIITSGINSNIYRYMHTWSLTTTLITKTLINVIWNTVLNRADNSLLWWVLTNW